MEINDKLAVVTGAGSGIGEALCEALLDSGARHVVVVDRDSTQANRVATNLKAKYPNRASAITAEVNHEPAVVDLVGTVQAELGPIDLFCSNAGFVTMAGLEESNEVLQMMWQVHVMAHVYAARAVIPSMVEQGHGYLLNTASAAGLLTQIGSMGYAVTKHAAVALAEWLAITHHHQGIRVSVLCPQAVATNIVDNSPNWRDLGNDVASADGVISAQATAQACLEAITAEKFWVLPHSEVHDYVLRKANDIDRWLNGMRRFQQALYPEGLLPGDVTLSQL